MSRSASIRQIANHTLTVTAATAFVAQVIFAQLLDFGALVQTCCGDGFTTEPLSSSWCSILIEKNPFDAQFFALLVLSIPVLAFIILSRSIIIKVLLSILFIDQDWRASKILMSGDRLIDRNGCLACDVLFFSILMISVFCLLALGGLAAWRARKGLLEVEAS